MEREKVIRAMPHRVLVGIIRAHDLGEAHRGQIRDDLIRRVRESNLDEEELKDIVKKTEDARIRKLLLKITKKQE